MRRVLSFERKKYFICVENNDFTLNMLNLKYVLCYAQRTTETQCYLFNMVEIRFLILLKAISSFFLYSPLSVTHLHTQGLHHSPFDTNYSFASNITRIETDQLQLHHHNATTRAWYQTCDERLETGIPQDRRAA